METSALARHEPESSVATKIILLVFLSTFVSAVGVSWISIETARRQLWAQIHESYPAALERDSQQLLRWLVEGRRLTVGLATGHPSRDTLLTLIHDASEPARRTSACTLFRALLDPVAGRAREIQGFALIRPDGSELCTSKAADGVSSEQRTALARPDAPLVQAFSRAERNALLATSTPVTGPDGTLAAYLVGIFRADAMRDVLAGDLIDTSLRIGLVGADGALLLQAGLPDDRRPLAPREGPLPIGAAREYTNASGEHVIGSARPLGSLGWTLLVESPYEHAFAPVLAVLRRLLLIDVGVVALASLLAYAITASIVRPIEALSEGARRLASGGFDLEIPETGRQDELGLLTHTFNEMARRLQRSQVDLESANRRLQDQNQSLQASNEVLEQLSITDGLTKLHNHRFFQDHLTRETKRANRTGEPLSMVLLDIDDFKRLNDRLGHAAGDAVLQWIANVLSELVRDSDLLARYGGDEFAVVTSGTELVRAAALAEKLRAAVAEKPFALEDSIRPLTVTVSAGVAQYKGDRKKHFEAADQALYRAKAEGKNQVRISQG